MWLMRSGNLPQAVIMCFLIEWHQGEGEAAKALKIISRNAWQVISEQGRMLSCGRVRAKSIILHFLG